MLSFFLCVFAAAKCPSRLRAVVISRCGCATCTRSLYTGVPKYRLLCERKPPYTTPSNAAQASRLDSVIDLARIVRHFACVVRRFHVHLVAPHRALYLDADVSKMRHLRSTEECRGRIHYIQGAAKVLYTAPRLTGRHGVVFAREHARNDCRGLVHFRTTVTLIPTLTQT